MAAAGDTSSEGLKFGGGLFLTIAFITVCATVFYIALDGSKTATKKFTSLNTELSQSEFLSYDNSTVSGSQVLNSIRKYAGDNNEFGISVKTGKASTPVWYGRTVNNTVSAGTAGYGSVIGAGTGSQNVANDETKTDYINPNGSFTSQVIRDQNNMVRAIVFQQTS
ncbi:hypothetical protein YDYSY3_39520 [Paenibacillus chitinolyticus]|uniref:ABC transporter permease n=1 Tax=Paenibacillus chitinolyticus TaxID=79263 RepID=UPI0026E4C117|nr:ABC transporter permease [Paenibacillus chitinolyticus]GKS12952.1 hypothetical protein YDYSY3_39520 [Paenibacillus chitinolyticus]